MSDRYSLIEGPTNLHPYECRGPGKCVHCDREYLFQVNWKEEEYEHDPATCALCDPVYDGMPNPLQPAPVPVLSDTRDIIPRGGNMQTIDEITIEGEDNGWHLVLHTTDGPSHRFLIGVPDQFLSETRRKIGAWLAEGEAARASMPSNLGQLVAQDEYNLNDPKHPTYYDRMVGDN